MTDPVTLTESEKRRAFLSLVYYAIWCGDTGRKVSKRLIEAIERMAAKLNEQDATR